MRQQPERVSGRARVSCKAMDVDAVTLDEEKVTQCTEELLKASANRQESRLLDEPDSIHLSFSFKLVPLDTKTIRIKLPHSLHRDSRSVALIVKDVDRRDREWEKTERHYQNLLRAKGVGVVSEIIPLKALKLEYKTFESKLHLSQKHDVFLADECIIRLLPSLLGKHFYGRRKNPLQVNMRATDLRREIQAALDCTRCTLSGRGSTCTCVVGHTDMEPSQIVANVQAAAQQIASSIPGGPQNVRNFHLKTMKSKAFRIYHNKGVKTEVQLPARKRKVEEVEAEEITTLYGAKVRVLPNGVIKVIQNKEENKKQRKRSRSTSKGRLPGKPRAETKSKAKAKPGVQAQAKQAEPKVKAETQAPTQGKPKSKAKAQGTANLKLKTKVKGKAKAKAQAKGRKH